MIVRERPGHVSHGPQPTALMRILYPTQRSHVMTMEHAVPTCFEQTCLRLGWDERGCCEGCEDGVVDC